MTPRESAAYARSTELRASIARFRLVFVQLGAAFEPLRDHTLDHLRGTVVSATALIQEGAKPKMTGQLIVVTGLEELLTRQGDTTQPSLGALRDVVIRLMDDGVNVCLVSRAPRVAYSTIPGSSVLEDASLFFVRLLNESECPEEQLGSSGWRIPAAVFSGEECEISELISRCLQELGTGVLSAVDHALFNVDPRSADALKFLGHRDLEALRGAGLVTVDDAMNVELAGRDLLPELRNALSDLMSADSNPPQELGLVVAGLWYIERTIRAALRTSAVRMNGAKGLEMNNSFRWLFWLA